MGERPVDDRVLALVRREMSKNAGLTSSELFEKAKSISPAMRRLTIQQFHGRYPLRVSRELAKAGGGGKRGGKRSRRVKAARRRTAPAVKAPAARAAAPAVKAPAARAAAPAASDESIRKVLLELAQAVASSDAANLVMVVGQIDRYVDRIRAAGA